jgi:hypothetical protein
MSAYRNKNGPSTSTVQDRLNTVSQRLNFFLPMNHSANSNTPPQQQQQQQQQQQLANGNGNGSHGNGGNMNGNGNGTTSANGEDPAANYTLQGVMQWLNGEYRRYERERNNWEIERAALVVLVSVVSVDGEVIVGSSVAFDGDKGRDAEGSGGFNETE